MLGWGALLLVPEELRLPGFVVMATLELLVPIWAERPSRTSWHPRHIAERYGLFTLIVLGESVASATVAVQSALDSGSRVGGLAEIAIGGLLIVFSMWWVYFAQPAEQTVQAARAAFAGQPRLDCVAHRQGWRRQGRSARAALGRRRRAT